LVAATAVVTGFAKTLHLKKQDSSNTVDINMTKPPAIPDRFMSVSSYRELKISDVELLLDEYKKLALWSKTVFN
jgi:hypothetical protein